MDKVNLKNILLINKCITIIILFHQYLMIDLLLLQLNILMKHLVLSPMVKILLYPALFSNGKLKHSSKAKASTAKARIKHLSCKN